MKRQRTDHSGPENDVHLKLLFWTAVKDSEPKLQDISPHPMSVMVRSYVIKVAFIEIIVPWIIVGCLLCQWVS